MSEYSRAEIISVVTLSPTLSDRASANSRAYDSAVEG